MKWSLVPTLLAATLLVGVVALVAALGVERKVIGESAASTRSAYWDIRWRSAETPPPIQLGKDLLPPNLPGPLDLWAGGKPHSFNLTFDVEPGHYRLVLLSYEAHELISPTLSFALNGTRLRDVQMKLGAGRPPPYQTVKPALTVTVPLSTVSRHNTLVITNAAGSWVAPARVRLVGSVTFRPAKAAYLLLAERSSLVLLALGLGAVFFGVASRRGYREAGVAVLLVAGSTIVTAALAEIAFREWVIRNPAQRALRTPEARLTHEQDEEYAYVTMVQPSHDPEIPYEMKPNLNGSFLQQPMQTNAQGFRGPQLSVAKPPGVVRIVGLGDSVMLGWGVSYEDTALTRIGRMVEASVGKPTQTVNTGCPSYNTAVEVAIYRQKGRQYRPDVVVLIFLENDFGFPGLMLEPVDRYAFRKSYLAEQVRKGLVPFWADAADYEHAGFISTRQLDPLRRKTDEQLDERERWLRKVEAHYMRMTGDAAVKSSLKDLADMLREDGALGVVVYDPIRFTVGRPESYEKSAGWVMGAARELGLEAIDMTPVYERYLRERRLQRMEEGLWISTVPPDWHSNAAAHDLMARAVLELLDRDGQLKRLRER